MKHRDQDKTSDKARQPDAGRLPPDQAAADQAMAQKQTDNPGGRRGIEPDEQHRQSGHRISDQGQRKH